MRTEVVPSAGNDVALARRKRLESDSGNLFRRLAIPHSRDEAGLIRDFVEL